jgi:hypothetical protein
MEKAFALDSVQFDPAAFGSRHDPCSATPQEHTLARPTIAANIDADVLIFIAVSCLIAVFRGNRLVSFA